MSKNLLSKLQAAIPARSIPTLIKNNHEIITESKNQPLKDLFGRTHNYLRVSLTERCNLRCKYHYS
jgi:hypothetical protein